MNTVISVGSERIVSLRYTMKNAVGEVLADAAEQEPVKFLFGSGEILPGLESPLEGLRIGEKKSFSLSPETVPDLNETFHFDVIIDDIRPANDPESDAACGPGCDCYQ